MPAKTVEVTPVVEGSEYRFLAQGVTDLSQLSSIGLSGIGAAPGILPGSPSTELNVKVSANGSKYEFMGSGASDYCTSYSYSGSLYGDSLILNINDVNLANTFLAGSVWQPVPFKQSGLKVESTPFHLLWELDPSAGIDVDLTGILEAVFTIPFIPTYHDTAYSSIAQLLSSSLQTVAFGEDGNIIVRYYSNVGGATQLVTSVGNTLQYVVLSDQYLKLYPNPTSLFGLWLVAQSDSEGIPDISFTKPSRSEEIGKEELKEFLVPILKSLLPSLLDMTKDGITLEMSKTKDTLDVYLNTQVILGLLQQVAQAVAENPEVVQKLLEQMGSNPQLAELLPYMEKYLPQIDAILKATTKIEIGLSFNSYK